MADFIPKATPEPPATPPEDTKIKVGEDEYSQADIQRLVGLGKMAEEVETKYNTKLDRVYPEYTKATQEVKSQREKLAEYESQLTKLRETQKQDAQAGQPWTPEQKAQAKQQLQDLVGGKIMTDTEFEQKYAERRAGEKLLVECEEYVDEIDGSDGRPKFHLPEILEHMKETGIRHPLKAYKDKYETQLDEWKSKQIGSVKSPGLVTNTQAETGKIPPRVRITNDNLTQSIRDELFGASQ